MSKLTCILIAAAFVTLAYGAEGPATIEVAPEPSPNPIITTHKPDPTTAPTIPTIKPTNATTVLPPVTTPSTTTTIAPVTTKPTTPTPPPTTPSTKAPTTTSTKAPTTPTTVPPTKPTHAPKVDPDVGNWEVAYSNDPKHMCINTAMAVQFEIPYTPSGANKTETAYINIPKNANASGECGNDMQTINITWTNGTMLLSFKKVNESYSLNSLAVNITPDAAHFINYPDNKSIILIHSGDEFKVAKEMSYKCYKLESLNLTKSAATNDTLGQVNIWHMQLQAFQNSTSTGFADAVNCEQNETPDIVPIAVGCALAALVVVVVVAYLIGRRRSQARGYLSM